MRTKKLRPFLLGCAISMSWGIGTAFADTPKEQELEARIAALERLFGTVQTELAATKTENQQLRTEITRAATAPVLLPSAAQPAAPAAMPDGFRSGATTFKIGGFIKTVADFSRFGNGDVATGSLGRDFYLPQTIPVGGVRENIDNDMSAKQTRLWLSGETAVAGHVLKGYVEMDFQTAAGTQGTERTTNGYDLAMRRAYVQYDKFVIGQDWSTFQNVGTLPETTDFIGPTEGSVFARQPLIRYTHPLSTTTNLQLALENPETASANVGAPALIENDDDRIPDAIVRLNHTYKNGEISLAGIVRQLSVDNGAIGDTRAAYGVSVGGKFNLDTAKRYDLRFMATYGSGIGRYVGLNFAPDAVWNPTSRNLEEVRIAGGFMAFKVNWTPKIRSTFMASRQSVEYDDVLTPASLALFNKSSTSLAANLFWSPVRGFDVGVELRRGVRELMNGTDGSLDRLEFAAKYSF
jgi:DcaP outer membrane protein